MRSWLRICSVGWALAVALVGFAPAAKADVFAVAQTASTSPARTDLDIGLADVNTGVFQSLPAGVNTTTASEFHPSITADGRYLVFERVDHAAGTDRIIMADLTTGQTSDLFNAFEVATMHPTSPAIARDGGIVLTGGPVSQPTHTDVGNFPNGPYPHFGSTLVSGAPRDLTVDPTDDDSAFASLTAWRTNTKPGTPPGTVGRITMHDVGGTTTLSPSPFVHDAHPAIGAFGATMLFDRHALSTQGDILPGDIHFCTATGSTFVGSHACGVLPAIVNSSLNETRPALTADGRYLGFIRSETNGHERVFVFDTQTQTMLNGGVDLGPVLTPDSGNLSLYEKPVFSLTNLVNGGTIIFSLLQPSSVGILVQRVVGHHMLLGQRVPTLKPVGRVPFGPFHRGRSHVKWNLRVHAKRLQPGTYQITVRALTKGGKVRDMGTPRIIHVRAARGRR
jgi:hypothetical protein